MCVSFAKHIWTCNHGHNQDIKYFHDPKRFYPAPLKSVIPPQQCLRLTNLLFVVID